MDLPGWDGRYIIVYQRRCLRRPSRCGLAVSGRMLETRDRRNGLITQPDWAGTTLIGPGRPNRLFAVAGGNMDSSTRKQR